MDDNFWGEPIFSYTRKEAIDDGVLIDVSEQARKNLIKFNTVITAGVSAECTGDDDAVDSILRDFCVRARTARGDKFDFAPAINGKPCEMYAVIGPGDDPTPVITIMLPHED